MRIRLALLLLLTPLLLPTTPAWACSCAGVITPQSALAGADVVFAGEVLSREESRRFGEVVSPSAPTTYRVRVTRVYEGTAAAVQRVETVSSGASCGLELPASGPVLVFASGEDGALTAGLCGGSRVGADVPASSGPGVAPTAVAQERGPGRAAPLALLLLPAALLAALGRRALVVRRGPPHGPPRSRSRRGRGATT